ncbi:ATP synthase subunit a [Jannaschia aquimarina]|uniref:ATP synthase subunit a n=2 Tax=Jannaschia aquimarina TaxID=935700 RepID=A0A0D1D6K1_9RHOB|nr:ATP synthase subunit a [Jannaschia aquimarina]SNT27654.1 ATP synthase F0 subcomplex A subunit [Jannaschia aquimarina]
MENDATDDVTAGEVPDTEAAVDAVGVTAEADHGGGLSFHPMDQFIVKPLFGDAGDPVYWYTITNATFWMLLTVACVALLLIVATRGRAIVPSRGQSVAELAYGFVHKMVEDVSGKDALVFFPYIFTLFLFILFSNFLALIPTSFSPTSHIAVTAVMAVAVFVTVTVVGFVKNGTAFLSLFWVSSAPLALRPILAVIEVISYFVRPVSHSVRLAGSIMAGHAVLKVFAGFAALVLAAPLAIFGVVAIYGLEVLVAAIQAYVFTILTCVYLKDALHPHH